jgi:phosphatidylglycerophosphate synthase
LCAAGLVGLGVAFWLGLLLTGDAARLPVLGGAGVFALGMGIALSGLRRDYPHGAIGLCNLVTVARLALTSALIAALLAPHPAPWGVFAVAVIAFLLDGVDGWLARREGYASAFGARFDVEVDALLALTLALFAAIHGGVGAYVILLGLPRYLFVAAQVPFQWLNAPLPERFSRKVVCVLQIAALILVIVPGLPPAMSGPAAGIAALALLWSFWVDLRWLWLARS